MAQKDITNRLSGSTNISINYFHPSFLEKSGLSFITTPKVIQLSTMQFGCQSTDLKAILTFLFSLIIPITFYADHIKIPPNDDNSSDDDNKCELIGTFSLLTQAFLGFLCLSSLIVKRFYEYPIRRTWPVWAFDVSKQLIGATGVHIVNVFLSIIKSRDKSIPLKIFDSNDDNDDNDDGTDDPCDWYFLNIVFDCTIGVFVLYLVFKGVNRVCRDYFKVTQIESGQYGSNPNKPSFRAFMKQLTVYFSCLMITKLIVYAFMEYFEGPLLWTTSHILLIWLDEYPDEFEIFVVMFVVPVVMNCLQLILIDNFIQNQVMHKVNIMSHESHQEHVSIVDDNDDSIREDTNTLLEEERELNQDERCHHEDFSSKDDTDTSSTNNDTTDTKVKNYGTFHD